MDVCAALAGAVLAGFTFASRSFGPPADRAVQA